MDPTLSGSLAVTIGGSRGLGPDTAGDSVAEGTVEAVAVRRREHPDNAAPGAPRRQPSDHWDSPAPAPLEPGNSTPPTTRPAGSAPSAAAWSAPHLGGGTPASDGPPGSQIRTPNQHGST